MFEKIFIYIKEQMGYIEDDIRYAEEHKDKARDMIQILGIIPSLLMLKSRVPDEELSIETIIAIVLFFGINNIGMYYITFALQRLFRYKDCNVRVTAKCVGYSEHIEKMRIPIYEYTYFSKTYEKYSSDWCCDTKVDIGSTKEIKLDPRNPEEFIDDKFDRGTIKCMLKGIPIVVISLIIYTFI